MGNLGTKEIVFWLCVSIPACVFVPFLLVCISIAGIDVYVYHLHGLHLCVCLFSVLFFPPSDIVNTPKPDERAIMTYVSCFYHAFAGAEQVFNPRLSGCRAALVHWFQLRVYMCTQAHACMPGCVFMHFTSYLGLFLSVL